jgi:serine phosphatase RsbU (regulator of sigma subunit)
MEISTNKTFHKVLERQIRKLLGKGATVSSEMLVLFQTISETYQQYEEDRYLIAHTMDVSSQELSATNQELLQQKTALQIAYEQLRTTQAQLDETEKMLAMSKKLENAYSLLKEQTYQLEQAQAKHLSAIQRAKRIQNAMLPSYQKIIAQFGEAFIFYKPVDTVSGDFFWFSEQNDLKILIVVDCTGHGVPGAFMTVMASALLDEIVNTNGITSPDKILEQLDKKVTNSLMQGDDSTHDGMDISIVAVDSQQHTLTFAAAKQTLYYVSGGEFIEIKGAMAEIGGQVGRLIKRFPNTVINYLGGDVFYMLSDGYQSQFSHNQEKFMRKRLKETIKQYSNLPMYEQGKKFGHTFENWKGDNSQTDDILVIGFRMIW